MIGGYVLAGTWSERKNVVLKNIMENRNDDWRQSFKSDDKKHLRASFTCSYREGLAEQSLEVVLT